MDICGFRICPWTPETFGPKSSKKQRTLKTLLSAITLRLAKQIMLCHFASETLPRRSFSKPKPKPIRALPPQQPAAASEMLRGFPRGYSAQASLPSRSRLSRIFDLAHYSAIAFLAGSTVFIGINLAGAVRNRLRERSSSRPDPKQ